MKSRKNLLWAIIAVVAVVCLIVVFAATGNKSDDEKLTTDTNTEQTESTGEAASNNEIYEEGAMVEGIEGVKTFASALDGVTMISVSQDPSLVDPELIVWQNVWDATQQFEVVPEGSESRYRIYPVDQEVSQAKCLELDEESGKIVIKDKSDSKNQLFRIVYAGNDMFILQAYNEAVLGFDLNEDGTSNGPAIVTRPYEDFGDSRFEKWIIADVAE